MMRAEDSNGTDLVVRGNQSDVGAVHSADGAIPGDSVPVDGAFKPTAGQYAAVEAVRRLIKKPGAAGLVITGYAGVGKTTMLRLLGKEFGVPSVITPTGKAALRVSQASGLEAKTAHRWLYQPSQNPKTGKVEFVPKPIATLRLPANRLVLVDESSMIGRSLWADIWRAAKMHSLKIVLIGDGFQLPPVEDSKGLTTFSTMTPEFVAEHDFERVELTEVLRQAQDSPIVRASMALRLGMGADALAELPRVGRDELLGVCLATRAAGGVVISHANATRFRVNEAMRGGPEADPLPQPGEPLLILRNNYELDRYNGEQVTFDAWWPGNHPGAPELVKDRYSGGQRAIRYGAAHVEGQACVLAVEQLAGDLGDVGGWSVMVGAERWARARGLWRDGKPLPYLEANFGYCYTAHKSQGSEWPYALVLLEPSVKLHDEPGRRWAYTAITRGKSGVAVFYGRP